MSEIDRLFGECVSLRAQASAIRHAANAELARAAKIDKQADGVARELRELVAKARGDVQ